MSNPCSGVILAGGRARRLSGVNKAEIQIGGMSILERIQRVFGPLFQQTLLVTRTPLAFPEAGGLIVTDLYQNGRSALTGLHAGLFYADTPHVFVSACDAPFINKDLVAYLLQQVTPEVDVVIPQTEKGMEPLFAVYSRRCFEAVTLQLERRQFRIRDLFKRVRVRPIGERRLRAIDPELISFYNVNTPQDLVQAQQLADHQQDSPSGREGRKRKTGRKEPAR